MSLLNRVLDVISRAVRRSRGTTSEQDLSDELRHHIELEAEDLVRHGWEPEAARREAFRRFGGEERTKEQVREGKRGRWLADLSQDLAYALRSLRRTPRFTLVSVATLGIGIGATVAIFSVLNRVLLEPLPYPDGQNLVAVVLSAPGIDRPEMASAPFLHFTYAEESRAFERVGLWRQQPLTVVGNARTRRVSALVGTWQVLPTLGVEPFLGRLFTAADDIPGGARTVIATYGFWQREFGGDPSALGQTVVLDGDAYEIVGVMAEDFRFLDRDVEVILPYQFDRADAWLGGFGFASIARLRPGWSLQDASEDVARMIPLAIAATPPQAGSSREAFAERLLLTPNLRLLRDDVVGGASRMLWIVMGGVLVMLLVAWANVASLTLVRAEQRRNEFGVRAALGAGRGRLVVDQLMEGILVGALAGALGVFLARLALPRIVALAPDGMPWIGEISVEPRVTGLVAVLSIVSGGMLGLIGTAPQWKGARTRNLRGGHRGMVANPAGQRLLRGIVVAQVALSLVLLVGSGLMVQTYRAMNRVDLGFDSAEGILTAPFAAPEPAIPDADDAWEVQATVLQRLAELPGITAVGISSGVPMDGAARANETLMIEGRSYSAAAAPALRRVQFVSHGYFEALGTDLIAGRLFDPLDLELRRPVALVSEAQARQEWGSPGSAVGRRIRSAPDDPWREVVGVVQDVHDEGPHMEPPATAFFPLVMDEFWGAQTFVWRESSIVARTSSAGTMRLAEQLEEVVREVGPDLPLGDVRSVAELVGGVLASHTFALALLGLASLVALGLGFLGIYGVLSYIVSLRTREIGLRIALGARPGKVAIGIVRQGVALATLGVLAGLGVAAACTRLLASLLFQTDPLDPTTLAVASGVLVVAAVMASYRPARGASRVDPMTAIGSQ